MRKNARNKFDEVSKEQKQPDTTIENAKHYFNEKLSECNSKAIWNLLEFDQLLNTAHDEPAGCMLAISFAYGFGHIAGRKSVFELGEGYQNAMKADIIKAVINIDSKTYEGRSTIEFIYGAVRGYLREVEGKA